MCCRILSSLLHFSTAHLLFLLGGWGNRHLLEQFSFAFSMQRSPEYWLPRELKWFDIRYLGNCYAKLHSAGGGSRLSGVASQYKYRVYTGAMYANGVLSIENFMKISHLIQKLKLGIQNDVHIQQKLFSLPTSR
jgi:hypothetical protein